MGQEEALLPAAVAFSWEHGKGVPAAVAFSWEHGWEQRKDVPAVEARGMPATPRKSAPAPASATVVVSWEHEPAITNAKPALARRLLVPPPPGGPTVRSVWRAVRPEEDPFLAAYLVCTKNTGDKGGKKRTSAREPKKGQRRFAWAVLGLGELSCRRDSSVVEQSMVRLAKLPELDPRDA